MFFYRLLSLRLAPLYMTVVEVRGNDFVSCNRSQGVDDMGLTGLVWREADLHLSLSRLGRRWGW
jgi:hypothetical protein